MLIVLDLYKFFSLKLSRVCIPEPVLILKEKVESSQTCLDMLSGLRMQNNSDSSSIEFISQRKPVLIFFFPWKKKSSK